MSKTYKVTEKIKQEILCTANKCFKEYGYNDTTFQMIADELNISNASISYHFKAKALIVYSLCEIFINRVYSFIRENINNDFNYYEYYCIAHLIIYREILKSRQNIDLYFHKAHVAVWEHDCIQIVENYYKEIARDFKKDFDEEEIRAIAIMNIGAKLSIIKEYTKPSTLLNIDKCCKHMMYLVGVLLNLDEATINKNIDRAFSFVDGHAEIPALS